jgi:RES domain-containing protein
MHVARLALLLVQRADRATEWIIGDEVISSGAKGILFKSRLAPNGTVLVLYTEHLDSTDQLDMYDPHGMLPKNQSSWK